MSTIAQIDAALSDEDFEILVRLRLQRAFTSMPKSTSIIMLIASTDYGKQDMKSAEWHIGMSGSQTKGEILGQCIVEHNRRHDFTASCKLRLIETVIEPEPEPASTAEFLGDEITF